MGYDQFTHFRCRAGRCKHVGEERKTFQKGRLKGGRLMSLLVDIRKNFGDFSLEAFFEVKNREFIGLLGASGQWKECNAKMYFGR